MVRDVEGLIGEADRSRTQKASHRQAAYPANGTPLNKELLFFIFSLLVVFTHGTGTLEKFGL